MTYDDALEEAIAGVHTAMLNFPLGPTMKAEINVAILRAFELGADVSRELGEKRVQVAVKQGEARVDRVFAAWRESNKRMGIEVEEQK